MAHCTHYREIFNRFDKNKDGKISKDEIRDAMKEMGLNPSDAECSAILQKADSNQDGYVQWNEFEAFLNALPKHVHETCTARCDLRARFKSLDTDNNGFLTEDELLSVTRQCNLPDSHAKEMMAHADKNRDGKISYDEFCQAFKK